MNEEERHKKFNNQTGDLYRAYGEFAVKFEHICNAIHLTTVFILSREGLKNKQVTRIFLAGLTADPLRGVFAALVAETQKLDNHGKEIIDSVLRRFQVLTERRNDIIHGTWFIGWANPLDTDFSVVSGHKLHRNKNGASSKSFKFSVEDFQALSQEAEALAEIFLHLNGCFGSGSPTSVSSYFKVNDDGYVSVP